MGLADDLTDWMATETGVTVVYQHGEESLEDDFVWFARSGEERLGCLDDVPNSEEADIVTFDVEIYANDRDDLASIVKSLKDNNDLQGELVTGSRVQDIMFSDQSDEYEPQAISENMPPFLAVMQLTVMGYQST